jgi:hypothetical protein
MKTLIEGYSPTNIRASTNSVTVVSAAGVICGFQ